MSAFEQITDVQWLAKVFSPDQLTFHISKLQEPTSPQNNRMVGKQQSARKQTHPGHCTK